MNAIHRVLLLLGLILWIATPGVSGEGGDNAGGTGIWILPRASSLASPVVGPPRAALSLSSLSHDLTMRVSVECGLCTAVFVDGISQVPVALSVVGSNIKVPATLMQAVVNAGCNTASIVITDAAQVGYAMQMVFDISTGTAIIRVM